MTRQWMHWLPAIVAPVVIAAGAVTAGAAADVDLPDRTPEQVLALAARDTVRAFSGTIEQSSGLGLPALPTTGPAADDGMASALELLTGTHAVRVYVDGPARTRLQVMDDFDERDLVRDGSSVWTYDSAKKTATHVTVPARSDDHRADDAGTGGTGVARTPADIAHDLLARLTPSTSVTLGKNTSVAGRSAYDLVLTPRNPRTLVGSVSIAVDAATGMPLGVRITPRGHTDPAVDVAFSRLTLERPVADLFAFTPPPGTDVTRMAAPTGGHGDASHPGFTVTGSDWTSVVELPVGSVPAGLLASPTYAQATTPVAGGRLLSTSLLNILVTDDGRVLAGPVTPDLLQSAASE
jgi:outer membrane lipoprotein-sorting protein